MKVGKRRQSGSFIIELALSLIVINVVNVFLLDISLILLNRTQAERASYSLVSVLHDRTRFYNGSINISSNDAQDIHKIANNLIELKSPDNTVVYSIRIESLIEGKTTSIHSGSLTCTAQAPIESLSNLVPEFTSDDGDSYRAPLYQVTVCIEYNSLFKNLIGANGTRSINASSVILGR